MDLRLDGPPVRTARAVQGPPCAMVIFGSSGDLTKRLLIPALYNLATCCINHKVVRIRRSGDHCLAQARISVDHSLPPLAGQWIGCEEHACHC